MVGNCPNDETAENAEMTEAAANADTTNIETREKASDEAVQRALSDPARRARLLTANEALFNDVIAAYLDELCGTAAVPVMRGFGALSPLPRPRTLEEAKKIVDGR